MARRCFRPNLTSQSMHMMRRWALGHGKWWLDGKTGANKCFCQWCMCCMVCLEVADTGKNMLSPEWAERDRETITVSPADGCIHLLSNPSRVNGIKSKGMRVKCNAKALVSCNNYASYMITHSRLQNGPAKGEVQWSPCALQHPHGPGPWFGLGGAAPSCLQLRAVQEST